MYAHLLRLVILLVVLFALVAPIQAKWIVLSWSALAFGVIRLFGPRPLSNV